MSPKFGKMTGGTKKKGSEKTSKKMTGSIKKKGSKNTSKKSKKGSKKMSGGGNPGFKAFQELKKKVASVLNIPNDAKAFMAAAGAQREIKEKNPGMSAVEVSKKAFELFQSDIEKYRKLAQ